MKLLKHYFRILRFWLNLKRFSRSEFNRDMGAVVQAPIFTVAAGIFPMLLAALIILNFIDLYVFHFLYHRPTHHLSVFTTYTQV